MRFDDSLKTVLSADMASGFGAQSAWRQLVDLMGRRRVAIDEPAIARLRMLRQAVPVEVRAASGRALAFAAPDARLVGFFAEDELAIAAPILRTATLDADDWIALLPRLDPARRSVLRHRRDLPAAVGRALEAFGPVDFVIGDDTPAPVPPEPLVAPPPRRTAANDAPVPPRADTPLSETSFKTLSDVAQRLPVVAEALRHSDARPLAAPPQPGPSGFVIADLVARIDAFNKRRGGSPAPGPPPPAESGVFRYETDADGVIRWVEGVARAALIGVSLAYAAVQGAAQVDGVATGALRRRSSFTDARLELTGLSDAAGSWRLSGVPVFDGASGRFTGLRGTGRRPRADESAAPHAGERAPASDALRQLVHELRTPTNAIAGFAELIETELLGPVPALYRDRAATIRGQASDLLAAIDDLDMAARIEGHALELRTTSVPVVPLLTRIVADLQPLAALRGTVIALAFGGPVRDMAGDDRAIDRLIGRLMAALVSAGAKGEQIGVSASTDMPDQVMLRFDRPQSLGADTNTMLLSLDGDNGAEDEGAPLLGIGFALRLARKLATELGGTLVIGADDLTLRLPAVVERDMGQASNN